jgi:Tfp pilus assembly protein PilF
LRRSDQFTAAREALTEATRRGTTARTEYERACLLDELDAYRLKPKPRFTRRLRSTQAIPSRNGLGNTIAEQSERADEAAYRKAIEIDPAYAAPWNNLGNLLAKQPERADEAEAAYRKAIELDPAYAAPWNNLGNLLAKQPERTDEAEAAYRKAIEIDPAYAAPWNNLGNLLAKQPERTDEAEAAYRKAIESTPPTHSLAQPRPPPRRTAGARRRGRSRLPQGHRTRPHRLRAMEQPRPPPRRTTGAHRRSRSRLPQGHRTRSGRRNGPWQPGAIAARPG